MAERLPAAPAGLRAAGRRLWKATVADFELSEHELGLLRETCRTADSLDALQTVLDQDGVIDVSPQGRRAHPALVELRQQRVTYARLIAQLGFPTGDEELTRRGSRGVYGITGVVSS